MYHFRNILLVPAGRQLNMGGMRLEIPCSKGFYGITPVPQLDWSMDDLISELNEIELKQNRPLVHPMPQKETKILGFSDPKNYGAFMMHVSDDDMDNIDGGEHTDEPMTGTRFSCTELILTDGEDFEDDLNCETVEDHLMDETGLVEGILFELERGNQLRVKEEIQNKFSAWEADLRNESERSASAIVWIEKYIEARREMDRRLDRQYQRKIFLA